MIRFGKTLWMAATLAAFGLASEARATFLVQVTATLNPPTEGSVTVGQSTTALSAFTGNASDLDLGKLGQPVHQTYGVTTTSSGNTSATDMFNRDYSWTLNFSHIVDGKVVGTGDSLVVTGNLKGGLSAYGSTLANTFTGGPVDKPIEIVVDGRTLVVQLDAWTPTGTPTASTRNFSVGLNYTDGHFQPVPEPAAFALMGVGGLLLAAPRLRRRLRAAASAA